MHKKPLVAFTVADSNNEKYLKMFKNSLRKFHSEEELPLIVVDQAWLNRINDPMKFYRMTPLIARDLIKDYEVVLKFDCDQIVCGKLNHLWENTSYDLGCVLNGNPKEPPYSVWDIHPAMYMNCGLVAMASSEFVHHWWSLCSSPHFNSYQFKEQDLMNIIYHYGNYDVTCFDASNNWNGLVSKGWWQFVEKRGEDLILPKGDRMWPVDGDKTIKVIHWAGGQEPNKMNYQIHFSPEVSKYLDYLVGDKK